MRLQNDNWPRGHGSDVQELESDEAQQRARVPAGMAFTVVIWALASVLLLTFLSSCTPNAPPTSDAGPDRAVESGEHVTLTGEGTDPDGSVQEFHWQQIAGPPVPIDDTRRQVVRFIAPIVDAPVTLLFRLTVTDDSGAAASDEAAVVIEPYGVMDVAVSGRVRSHRTQAPIAGATVTVSQYDDGKPYVVGTANADAQGRFEASIPARPGRLTVTAQADGFVPQSAVIVLADGAESAVAALAMVPVEVAQRFRGRGWR